AHYRVPVLARRLDRAQLSESLGPDDPMRPALAAIDRLDAAGWPFFDRVTLLPLDQPEDRLEEAKHEFASLVPGLNLILIHPAIDTPELRAITPRASVK